MAVRLKLLPVCECGHVFRDGVTITKDTNETKGSNGHIRYGTYHINPPTCPNCKRLIEGIEYNKEDD